MNVTGVLDVLFQMGMLLSVVGVGYGAWLYIAAPSIDKRNTLGPNRPKTLGWRE